MARWIAGVDGCRGRWAIALLDLDDSSRHRLDRVDDLGAVLDGPEAPVCLAVDVPIGLPSFVRGGGRAADLAARALLGRSRSSVFAVPSRAALYAPDYESAKRLARATSDPPRAPSIQCWQIRGYVRAVDRLLRERPELRERVHEVHPEVVFSRLNAGRPLGAGKRTPEGGVQRRRLLVGAGLPRRLVHAPPAPGVAADDHLDALAALVTARAIVEGSAMSLPDPPDTDPLGLPIAIWAPRPPSGGHS